MIEDTRKDSVLDEISFLHPRTANKHYNFSPKTLSRKEKDEELYYVLLKQMMKEDSKD